MTRVIGNSKCVVADLLAEGAPPDRVGLIYNGVSAEHFHQTQSRRSATRAALGLDRNFLMICVANLIAYKGHADLIAALAQYRTSLPSHWRLLLVGRDDGVGGSLKANVAQHAIADHILFLGKRTDIPDLLAAADLFILPSHEEGFSNAVLEAMAAGLPVIATQVGGNAEAVVEGETGLIVPPGAPTQLGAAIVGLASAPAQRRAFGAAGAERVKKLFSLEACVKNYDQLYRILDTSDGD